MNSYYLCYHLIVKGLAFFTSGNQEFLAKRYLNLKIGMVFSNRELELIKDLEFLPAKKQVIQKVKQSFTRLREDLRSFIPEKKLPDFSISGKISSGENYRDYPYVVLDYPAIFRGNDIFACRTMFWWGHFFSTTVHLQGYYLLEYESRIIKHWEKICAEKVYLSCGENPWEYHFGADNYQLAETMDLMPGMNRKFIKISQRYELEDFFAIEVKSRRFYEMVLGYIVE